MVNVTLVLVAELNLLYLSTYETLDILYINTTPDIAIAIYSAIFDSTFFILQVILLFTFSS